MRFAFWKRRSDRFIWAKAWKQAAKNAKGAGNRYWDIVSELAKVMEQRDIARLESEKWRTIGDRIAQELLAAELRAEKLETRYIEAKQTNAEMAKAIRECRAEIEALKTNKDE